MSNQSIQFRGVIESKDDLGADINFFITNVNGVSTPVSRIDIGIITLVRIANIVYMNIPAFTFVNTGDAADFTLEIKWVKSVPNPNGPPTITYESMATFNPDFIPSTSKVVSNYGSNVYFTYSGGGNTMLPNVSQSFLNLPLNGYITYCSQKLNAGGLLPNTTVNPGVTTDFSFGVVPPFTSPSESYTILSTGVGVYEVSNNSKYIKFAIIRNTVSQNNPISDFNLKLLISTDQSLELNNEAFRYPVTIYPSIYTYYV